MFVDFERGKASEEPIRQDDGRIQVGMNMYTIKEAFFSGVIFLALIMIILTGYSIYVPLANHHIHTVPITHSGRSLFRERRTAGRLTNEGSSS